MRNSSLNRDDSRFDAYGPIDVQTTVGAFQKILTSVLDAADPTKTPNTFKEAYTGNVNQQSGPFRQRLQGIAGVVIKLANMAEEDPKIAAKLSIAALLGGGLNAAFYTYQSCVAATKIIANPALGTVLAVFFSANSGSQSALLGTLASTIVLDALFDKLTPEERLLVKEQNFTNCELLSFKVIIILALIGGTGATTIQFLLGISESILWGIIVALANFPVNTFATFQLLPSRFSRATMEEKIAMALQKKILDELQKFLNMAKPSQTELAAGKLLSTNATEVLNRFNQICQNRNTGDESNEEMAYRETMLTLLDFESRNVDADPDNIKVVVELVDEDQMTDQNAQAFQPLPEEAARACNWRKGGRVAFRVAVMINGVALPSVPFLYFAYISAQKFLGSAVGSGVITGVIISPVAIGLFYGAGKLFGEQFYSKEHGTLLEITHPKTAKAINYSFGLLSFGTIGSTLQMILVSEIDNPIWKILFLTFGCGGTAMTNGTYSVKTFTGISESYLKHFSWDDEIRRLYHFVDSVRKFSDIVGQMHSSAAQEILTWLVKNPANSQQYVGYQNSNLVQPDFTAVNLRKKIGGILESSGQFSTVELETLATLGYIEKPNISKIPQANRCANLFNCRRRKPANLSFDSDHEDAALVKNNK